MNEQICFGLLMLPLARMWTRFEVVTADIGLAQTRLTSQVSFLERIFFLLGSQSN